MSRKILSMLLAGLMGIGSFGPKSLSIYAEEPSVTPEAVTVSSEDPDASMPPETASPVSVSTADPAASPVATISPTPESSVTAEASPSSSEETPAPIPTETPEETSAPAETAESVPEETITPDPAPSDPDAEPKLVMRTVRRAVSRAPAATTEASNITGIKSFNVEYVSGGTSHTSDSADWEFSNNTWSKSTISAPYNAWDATRNTSNHAYVYRANLSTSGKFNIPVNTLQITIPLHIFRGRDGAYADTLDIGVPIESEWTADDANDYAYRIDGDKAVIYNARELTAANDGYVEFSYSLDRSTFDYKDMTKSDSVPSTFTAGSFTASSEAPSVFINTSDDLISTSIDFPTLYKKWASSWGDAPADADNYWYLLWPAYVNTGKYNSQPYNLTLTSIETSSTGSPETFMWRLPGSYKFTTNNVIENSHGTERIYVQMLGRLKKSEFDKDTVDRFMINNKLTAVLHPIDEIDPDITVSASRDFSWERPVFKFPTGHFNAFKRGDGSYRTFINDTYLYNLGRRSGDYTRYDLETFKGEYDSSGAQVTAPTVNTLGNFDWAAWVCGYPYPWTLEDGANWKDPDNFGKKPVTFQLVDEGLYLYQDGGEKNTTRALTADDFEWDTITYLVYINDARFNDDTQAFEAINGTFAAGEKLNVFLKFGSDTDWTNAGYIDLSTNTPHLDEAKVTMNGNVLTPADNCIAYKLVYDSAHYYTEIDSVPNGHLKNSEYVMNTIKDWDSIAISNQNTGIFLDYKGKEVLKAQETDSDFARITERVSNIDKSVVSSSNNKKKQFYTITWKADMSETYTYGEGTTANIEQNGGVYYDLIPYGQTFNPATTAVRINGYEWLGEGDYTVESIPNYKDTGRTLAIIRINVPFDTSAITFDTTIAWNTISDIGTDVYNPIAFETGNDDIKFGTADDGGNLKEDDKPLMSGLDPASAGKKKFIYADEYYDIVAITAATTGLRKQIMADESGAWSYSDETYLGGGYLYQLRYKNSFTSKSKNMIFYDSLENYVNDNASSDWHGTLEAIDTTVATGKGAAPVVYISTVEKLNLDEHHDLSDTTVWQQVNPSDKEALKTAKAVAVDLSKDASGNDFTLEAGDSISVNLRMKAPNAVPVLAEQRIPTAYNNVYMSNTVMAKDSASTEESFFIHHDYTQISLKVKADFQMNKVSSVDKSPIKGIQFRVYGTSSYGTPVDMTEISGTSGIIKFPKIEQGSYTLVEVSDASTAPDWLPDHTPHVLEVTGEGKVLLDGIDYTGKTGSETFTVENSPRVHQDLTLYKAEIVRTH